MKQIKAVNDFVIKFANINGSGSASANLISTKSIFDWKKKLPDLHKQPVIFLIG